MKGTLACWVFAPFGAPAGRCLLVCWGCSSGWLERTPDKREVGGSIPPSPTFCLSGGVIAQLVEHLLCKQEAVGSNPTNSTVPRRVGRSFFDMMIQVIRTARCNTPSVRFRATDLLCCIPSMRAH